jgi:CRISPR-associated protein Csy3
LRFANLCKGDNFEAVKGYIAEYGFNELAQRYAINLANGRFLWRNRIGCEKQR